VRRVNWVMAFSLGLIIVGRRYSGRRTLREVHLEQPALRHICLAFARMLCASDNTAVTVLFPQVLSGCSVGPKSIQEPQV
jgi:hypothetical protein